MRAAAVGFTGKLNQLPPAFSAKEIYGVPAYELARKGKDVELQPKAVEVREFEIINWDGRDARFTAWVSSGTYIRTLAHDLGRTLGPGAHLAALERTAVREFMLKEAHSLEQLEQAVAGGRLGEIFLHPRLVLPEFSAVTAPAESGARIKHGAPRRLAACCKCATV